MFKVGYKIVCVEVPYFTKPIVNSLTIGKVYDILEIRRNHTDTGLTFFVIDDMNNTFGYSSERFVSIAEYRKRKLKKICSNLVK